MTTTSGVHSTQTAVAKAAAAKAAAAKAAQAKAAAAAAAAQPAAANTAQLPMLGTNVGAPGMVSPYDGTTPNPAVGSGLGMAGGLGGYPVETGAMPGSMAGLGAGGAQTNATNQSALATNGNVNQDVSNSNEYHNTYLNIIQSPYGSAVGYGGVNNGAFSGWGAQQQGGFGTPYVVDPATGQVYVQKKDGIIGWFQRLFRGY